MRRRLGDTRWTKDIKITGGFEPLRAEVEGLSFRALFLFQLHSTDSQLDDTRR